MEQFLGEEKSCGDGGSEDGRRVGEGGWEEGNDDRRIMEGKETVTTTTNPLHL